MRQVTDRPPTADHGPDVISLLTVEHGRLRTGCARVLEERHGPARRARMFELAELLVRHDTAEQAVVYPIVAHIEGGTEFRREVLRQERDVAKALAKLLRRLRRRSGGRRSTRKIKRFSELLEGHLQFEERSLLPILRALESEQDRQMMGTWVRRVEAVAPTRPHPHAPQKSAGLFTIGLALGAFDRRRSRQSDRNATAQF